MYNPAVVSDTCTTCNLFADDTAIYCHGSDITDVNITLQNDVINSVKWLNDNMLTVNIDKSCYIAIGTRKSLSTTNIEISVENNIFPHVNNVKYLIDCHHRSKSNLE